MRDSLAAAQINVQSWRESFAGIRPQPVLDSITIEQRYGMFRQRFKDPSYRMFVAQRSDGDAIGFVDFGPPREATRYSAEIYALYVLNACQRQGVGTRLFLMVVDAMLAEGNDSLCLIVLEDSPFRAFYEKLGGRQIGRGGANEGQDAFAIYGWTDVRHIRDRLPRARSDASMRAPDPLSG
jgi:ribosomal protein S18 acetylase RimI-like enzyme